MMSHKQNMVQIRITVHHSNTGVCRSKVKKKMVLITQWAIMSSQVTNQTLKDDLTDLHSLLKVKNTGGKSKCYSPDA